ncbi:MAG: hypothetical protein IGR80_03105 [Synechococcales cyanobacterium K44_A2020_017]|uniref:YaaW family protein n=1 Tax=Leptolyngbya sp. CCY15150 TaxID=2767772 RepID=UPI001951524A|nr:hypothetical protein [Synechococcales cyanobacterium K32_A2020_035]MBF2093727.1 hypothetical protein [Synechococcales cyanobacterium K44_A2020_017]
MDELRTALELATDEELSGLTNVLFHRQLNPLDYLCAPDPIDVQSQDRLTWLDSVEERFRFLAADGVTVIRGQSAQVSYRQVLIQVCRYLKIPYSQDFSTLDLESEIFLHLLQRACKSMNADERRQLNQRMQRSLSQLQFAQPLPANLQQNPMGVLLKGSSALALSAVVRPLVLQQLARQIAIHMATYQVAQQAIAKGGVAIATQIQARAAMQTATRGIVLNTARYTAVRSVLAVLGPAMWAWFFADLGWRAIATNYGRIIPVVFTLAQIRLTRADCFGTA